ncbi:hypothetical protein DPEC_G00184840 [Dallia pectoralis]|uniref:Uncharacterized protein n=1 Tax=Dallia pectoralis TaxID=75939 RepID=A0ACC2GBD7_DALPE|nr:hypothetical protein DPEC_G00184840 [Dallia pectoralis]
MKTEAFALIPVSLSGGRGASKLTALQRDSPVNLMNKCYKDEDDRAFFVSSVGIVRAFFNIFSWTGML